MRMFSRSKLTNFQRYIVKLEVFKIYKTYNVILLWIFINHTVLLALRYFVRKNALDRNILFTQFKDSFETGF